MDYDIWSKLGARGWSYSEVFPYFIKSEKALIETPSIFEPDYHGDNGPLSVSSLLVSLHDSHVWKAISELGLPKGDYNGKRSDVFNLAQITADIRGRVSTGRAYLGPASFRANLDVIVGATVTQLLINPISEAYGVVFVKDGKKTVLRARKEVILSAGVYNTPKLLMLSGIGPKNHLNKLGIPVKVNLPGVGQNFQYHPQSEVHFKTNITEAEKAVFIGNVRSKYAPDRRPDLEFELFNYHVGANYDYDLISWLLGYGAKLNKQYLDPHSFEPGFYFIVLSLRCFSRGEVKLRSPYPFDEPIIDHKVFSDKRDLRAVVEALKIANKLAETPVLRINLQARPYQNTIPGCEHHKVNSEPFFVCLARSITFDGYHPCCTAKMGSKKDPMAVVDPYLRVYGVKKLRIVDSSVMPEITSGNLNAPTIMIAEKASDMIKNSKG